MSTTPDTYNPWQTIRAFKLKKNTTEANDIKNPKLKSFITNTNENIDKILTLLKQNQRDNLTKQEYITLRNLTNNDQIIINKADKGSTVVVLNKADYIKEGIKHLCDPSVYRKLNNDITDLTKIEINKFLSKITSSKQMPWQMTMFCKPPINHRTSQLYFL